MEKKTIPLRLKVEDTVLDSRRPLRELNLILQPWPRPIKNCPRLNPNKPNQQGQEVAAN